MHSKPLVSILIVAYNPGEYLRNTLRTCIEQTYKNTEVLILDNNSSEDIFQYFPEKNVIQYFRSEKNLGPYNGLNYLLKKAHGKYIAIQDHDDIWHKEKLERQVEFLEKNSEYIGCGTKTIMYYESDEKYFEYSLSEKNYYTIHPSLLFRNDKKFRYSFQETEYMCDAWSLKNNLCNGEKKIYNIDAPLTLHLIKNGSTNYSYKWHKLTWINIRRVFNLHSPFYAILTVTWEINRKLIYPILRSIGHTEWIDSIERIPFRIFGNTIRVTQPENWWKEYF